MQLREVPENPKSGRQLPRMLGVPWLPGSVPSEDFMAAPDSGKGPSPAIMCSSPPGLTDEEIDLAFQQSGTAADEPSSLGPATQVVPVQPPHLVPQPYSKSPAQTPAFTVPGAPDPGRRTRLLSPRLSKLGDTGSSSWAGFSKRM